MSEQLSDGGNRPVVAIVGRPNVGKSTLVNRVLGARAAVVEDVPGVTRDRVTYDANWAGRDFVIVDTGGWEPDAQGLAAQIAAQAEVAMDAADVVVLVVDGIVGATDTDEAVIKVLRRSKSPVILAVNKVDDARSESDASQLWSLGLGEPFPVSALHGRGSGELLDAIVAAMPETPQYEESTSGPRKVALIGRPNVGKSSLLNRLSGETRSVVDDVAGTTRDPVDTLVEVDGQIWRFVDTAGIRRRGKDASGAEYYSLLRTQTALESAEVAIVLLDASQPLAEQDQRVVGIAVESGRALVLAINKWDLLDEERQHYLERELELDFGQVKWAPRVNISALTGRSVDKLARAMRVSLDSWDKRIPTGTLNAWLGDVIAQTPPPPRGGKAPKVLFATQAATRPPRFVIFTNGFLEAGYRRFLERKLREEFGFEGSPIEISVKVKNKDSAKQDRKRGGVARKSGSG